MSTTRDEFEAYWRERQLRTHRYTNRSCPDDWGLAFKADAETAWQASRRVALEDAAKACDERASKLVMFSRQEANRCASAIRALAGGTQEGQP